MGIMVERNAELGRKENDAGNKESQGIPKTEKKQTASREKTGMGPCAPLGDMPRVFVLQGIPAEERARFLLKASKGSRKEK